MISVVLADDHAMVREGVKAVLARFDDLRIVGEASDGEAAIALVAAHDPDVAVLDLRMAGMGGVEATRRIVAEHGRTRVLVLTTYDADADIIAAIEAGAQGYVLKDIEPAGLAEAIRDTAARRSVLDPRAAVAMAATLRGDAPPVLSAREATVLTGAAQGLTNGQIARRMGIGEATVKTYLARTFEKLGARDRTSAVAAALAKGLIELP